MYSLFFLSFQEKIENSAQENELVYWIWDIATVNFGHG